MMKKLTVGKALIVILVLVTAGCGGKVEGNTYEDNGGVVKVEFKSGGKVYVSTGPVTNTCSYTESGKSARWCVRVTKAYLQLMTTAHSMGLRADFSAG